MTIDNETQAEAKFRDALAAAGIEPPRDLIADGRLHRCNAARKGGKGDAWYVLHMDGIPSGAFGDWAEGGESHTWCSKDKEDLTPGQWDAYQKRIAESRRIREAEAELLRKEARDKADRIWDEATPCALHPYLLAKGVRPHGMREYKSALVIPLRDATGEIQSLEFIGPDPEKPGKFTKKFLTGGRKSGCWLMLGTPSPNAPICVVEGFATGASVHEATGHATAIAFDCGNLKPVSVALRDKYPETKLILCADDDYTRQNNPGITKAKEAAKACNGIVAIPDFGFARPDGAKDWNDLHAARGLEAVKAGIDGAVQDDGGPIEACDLFSLVFSEIEARKSGKSQNVVKTGISDVDWFCGGLRRGYLTIVCGDPGSGKTSATNGILTYNASNGVPSLLFSLEMSSIDEGIRLVSAESMIAASELFDEETKVDTKRVFNACGRLSEMQLTVDDRPHTLAQIIDHSHRWFARSVKAKGAEVGLIAIDYLGLIKSEEGSQNRNREVAAFVQGAKLLARGLNVPVVMLAQLNRSAAKEDRDPQMSDLRDSGEIEAAADLIIAPRPAPRDESGMIIAGTDPERAKDRWLILKNRNGKKGAVQVGWIPELMLYTSLRDAQRIIDDMQKAKRDSQKKATSQFHDGPPLKYTPGIDDAF